MGWKGVPHLHSPSDTTTLNRRGEFPVAPLSSSRLREASPSSGTESRGSNWAETRQKLLQKNKLSTKDKPPPLPDSACRAYLPQSCWQTRMGLLCASGRKECKLSACRLHFQEVAEHHCHQSSTTDHQPSFCSMLRGKNMTLRPSSHLLL